MNNLIYIMFFLIISSCSPSSEKDSNSSLSAKENPVFSSEIDFKQEYYINKDFLDLNLENYLYDEIIFYNDEICQSLVDSYTDKIIQISSYQLNIDNQSFFYKQRYENKETNCQFAFKISHNNEIINSYSSTYWDNINGTKVNNLLFQIQDTNKIFENRIE